MEGMKERETFKGFRTHFSRTACCLGVGKNRYIRAHNSSRSYAMFPGRHLHRNLPKTPCATQSQVSGLWTLSQSPRGSNRKWAVGVGAVCVGLAWAFRQTVVAAEPAGKDETDNTGTVSRDRPSTTSVTATRDRPSISLAEAVERSRDLAQRVKEETGSPGLTVAVSVDGKTVWSEGFGYADVENRLPCHPDTVWRIASISKSITMATVAKLWESGDLDLDKPIQQYIPTFPQKTWEGEKVTITTRQLVSHLAGIRHYDKGYMKVKDTQEEVKGQEVTSKDSKTVTSVKKGDNSKDRNKGNNSSVSEFELQEYYITKQYNTVLESLRLFQDDPLVHKPDTKFLYTSHGWTLVSAVVEAAAKKPFKEVIKKLFMELGLENTYLDENNPLIYNRGRHYSKDKRGRLVNAAYVDLSYKWAGGGFVSSVQDLVKFGNIMLYSYQGDVAITGALPGYLKPGTVRMLWTPVANTDMSWDKGGAYGMGWGVVPEKFEHGCCRQQRYYTSHTGGAVGGSSVLLILPPRAEESNSLGKGRLPRGVVVAMIVNMTAVGLNKTALEISKIFEQVDV